MSKRTLQELIEEHNAMASKNLPPLASGLRYVEIIVPLKYIVGTNGKPVVCEEGDVIPVWDWYADSIIESGLARPSEDGPPAPEEPQEEPEEIDLTLDNLDIPARTLEALVDVGYDAESIAAASDDELLAVPGVGPRTLKQVRDKLSGET